MDDTTGMKYIIKTSTLEKLGNDHLLLIYTIYCGPRFIYDSDFVVEEAENDFEKSLRGKIDFVEGLSFKDLSLYINSDNEVIHMLCLDRLQHG